MKALRVKEEDVNAALVVGRKEEDDVLPASTSKDCFDRIIIEDAIITKQIFTTVEGSDVDLMAKMFLLK